MNFYRNHLKRSFDFLAAAFGLFLLAPLLTILALLIRLRLGSPVLFRQTRPGLHGKPFELIKFRSMTDARDDDGNLLPDAKRLTRFGRFLRKSSLDELPELWNVFKGEMSLVGPRPLLMEYLPYYTERERRRHDVRPGLTGWAQVSGRNFLEWDRRLAMDVQYVEKCSFVMDLRIVWSTILAVVLHKNVAAIAGTTGRKLNIERSQSDGAP